MAAKNSSKALRALRLGGSISLTLLMLIPALYAVMQKPAQTGAAGTETPPRKTSAAARQNPAIRTYFRERYGNSAVADLALVSRGDPLDIYEKGVDNLIDMSTEKAWKLAEELHMSRDRVWSAMTPETIAALRTLNGGTVDRVPGSVAAESRLPEIRVALKRMERLAGDIATQVEYIRFTLDVSTSFHPEKIEGRPGEKVQQDIEILTRSVSELEDALFEFFYPVKGAVSVSALTRESIPYILEKIRKLAERAYANMAGR